MKKNLIILVAAMVLAISAGVVYVQKPFFHQLTVHYPEAVGRDVQVELYRTEPAKKGNGHVVTDKIKTITNDKSTFLYRGVYALRTSGKNYHKNTRFINLSDSSKTVDYPLKYTQAHLQKLSVQEKDGVQAVIEKKYPEVKTLYSFSGDDALMRQGEWFVATLHYRGDSGTMRDTLRVVLHKQHSTWKLVTKPRIVLSKVDYPKIPTDVLSHANRPLPDPTEKQY